MALLHNFSIRIAGALAILAFIGTTRAQPGPMPDRKVDVKLQAEVIDSVMAAFRDYYIFPDVAARMEKSIRLRYKRGEYKEINSLREFARQLTLDLRQVSKDRHIGVMFIPDAEMGRFANPSPADDSAEIAEVRRKNFGFRKLEILSGDVGYLDLTGFIDARYASATAIAAMNYLGNSDAIIFDLRENGGGSPTMIQLICSYLFDEPTHLNDFYSRKADDTKQFWTQASVIGPRLAETPVYILTSDFTFSAAEEFTYDLQVLKRATVVGDTTGGGAHPVGGHFWPNLNVGARIPDARAVNPVTHTNWEGSGIVPDIVVPAEAALDRAHLEALKKIKESTSDSSRLYSLDWSITRLKVKLGYIHVDTSTFVDYVGTYGPRQVKLEGGTLVYQREDRPVYKLIPAGDDMFLLDGLDFFQIRFERDDSGRVTRFVGLYDDGQTDFNDRTN